MVVLQLSKRTLLNYKAIVVTICDITNSEFLVLPCRVKSSGVVDTFYLSTSSIDEVLTTKEVRDLTFRAAQMLLERGIKALVIACNTATAVAVTDLREMYPDTIIIGIEPALKVAADRFPGGTVGVMATPVTLREEKFHHQLERFPGVTVHTIPVPDLVALVEAGHTDDAMVEDLLRPVLTPYAGKLDAVVLGCTHYPFASAAISKILGEHTAVLDGGEGTARETRRRLADTDLLYAGEGSVQMENSTHDPEKITLCMALLHEKENGL